MTFIPLLFKFHCECHVLPPRFFVLSDFLDFFFDALRETPFCRLAVHIVEEGRDVRIEPVTVSLTVQEDFRRFIAHEEGRILLTGLTEGVDAFPCSKRVKGADEDDERFSELRVVLALVQNVHVHHGLVVACPFRQFVGRVAVRRLHLDVVERSGIIFNEDVEPHAFAVIADVDTFLRHGVGNP